MLPLKKKQKDACIVSVSYTFPVLASESFDVPYGYSTGSEEIKASLNSNPSWGRELRE
jgi:hypothetical protein